MHPDDGLTGQQLVLGVALVRQSLATQFPEKLIVGILVKLEGRAVGVVIGCAVGNSVGCVDGVDEGARQG